MLRIRLRRTGRRNRPTYRIVVAEHSAPLSGKVVEQLGHFDPRTKVIGLTPDRVMHWLSVGARPSNRVAKLLTSQGVKHPHIVVVQRASRAPKRSEDAASPDVKKPIAAASSGESAPVTASVAEPETAESTTDAPAAE